MMMPMVQMPMNSANSLGFTALRSIIIDGKLNVVTAIIKDKIVPSCAPLKSSASATGIVPKTEWLHCPICGNKTRNKVREDTVLVNYPLYCPKCKCETLITVKELKITVLIEPDA